WGAMPVCSDMKPCFQAAPLSPDTTPNSGAMSRRGTGMSQEINERAATSSAPEDLFVELFAQVFGLEKVQMLAHEYQVEDIYGAGRSIDYALDPRREGGIRNRRVDLALARRNHRREVRRRSAPPEQLGPSREAHLSLD